MAWVIVVVWFAVAEGSLAYAVGMLDRVPARIWSK